MKYGYWLPVFGGWLRNVEDERMHASWDYVRTLAKRSEEIGYDITLIAELLLNIAPGIGGRMNGGQHLFQMDLLLLCILLLCFVGVIFNLLAETLEKRQLRWRLR